MRSSLGLLAVLGGLLVIAERASAAERDKALAVINDAIQAHGGEDRLTKAKVMMRSSKGVMHLFGKESQFTADTAFQLPDRYRDVITIDAGGQKSLLTIVVNGEEGWNATGGMVIAHTKARLAEVREEILYVLLLTTLVPLKDKAYDLTLIADAKVFGLPALAVKVTSKGHGDATLYFDKESRLLVKLERKAQEGGLSYNKEYFFREHKDFEGLKMPTKYVEVMNGNKSIEMTINAYKFPGKIEESVFGKP